ncbi:MAG: sigma factor-like helix-turn-helix DNA-binding protein [Singulisphaera sp.]
MLCYLEGLTHDQAAQKLQWPVGTVRSRLSGAPASACGRGSSGGGAPSAAILERSLSLDEASAAVPASLVDSTARAVSLDAAGGAGAGLVSPHVAALVQRGMRTMLLNKLSWTVATALAGGLVALGAEGLATRAMEKPPRASRPLDDRPETKTDESGRGNPSKPPGDEPDRRNEANGARPPIAQGGNHPEKAPVSRSQRSGRKPPLDIPAGGAGAMGASPQPGPGEDAKSLAVLKKLDEPISMSFANETPLTDVLAYLRSATAGPNDTGIKIYVDPVGLHEAEKTMTSPVTMDLEGVPLRRTLYLLLDQLGLTYQVDDGIVFITAKFGETKRLPSGPTPFMLMQDRAERGEMDAAERKEYIEMLKDMKEIQSLLYQLDHVEEIETSSAQKGGTAGDKMPAAPGGAARGVGK